MTTRSGLTKWVAGNTVWSVNSRKEYGKDATSTRSGNVRPARHFTAQPVDDTPARREHAQRVSEINTEFAALKQQQVLSNEKKTQLTGEIAQKETELVSFAAACSLDYAYPLCRRPFNKRRTSCKRLMGSEWPFLAR